MIRVYVDCIGNDRRKISGATNLTSSLSRQTRVVLVVECSGSRQVMGENVGNCHQIQAFHIESPNRTARGILKFEGFYGTRFCEGQELRSQTYVPPPSIGEAHKNFFFSAYGDIILSSTPFFSATTRCHSTIAILVCWR